MGDEDKEENERDAKEIERDRGGSQSYHGFRTFRYQYRAPSTARCLFVSTSILQLAVDAMLSSFNLVLPFCLHFPSFFPPSSSQ